jgi:GMP synthase (glutamine-hydrolysing)
MFSRRSAVALRHVAFEDLGLLAPIMEREGWNVSFCEAAVDDLSHRSIRNADLVIVLGGPIGVYETGDYPFLTSELTLLEHRLSRDLPTLGICLGSQLMAKALGSRVFKGPVKEIGWGTINLTEEGRSSCLKALQGDDAVVLHWHGDTFDLPQGATRLASNCKLRESSLRLRQQRPRPTVSPRGRSASARGMVRRPYGRACRRRDFHRRLAGGGRKAPCMSCRSRRPRLHRLAAAD